ncbi:hypothetical protein G3I13_23875 [Streptomyces sp. SID6673]|nr:hypothetical protein [Streptomyces sp. SID11726]NEB27387.1 hypothetical protein [Streptomyces sp. SID6673]
MASDRRYPPTGRFGFRHEEVARAADTWRSQAAVIRDVDLAALEHVSCPSSRVASALRTVAVAARNATAAVAERLEALGMTLHRLRIDSDSEDRAVATPFTDLAGR